ncbi:uncharacterized protein [Syngnathus scovelli]|uniref:uncharacterized protein n=1 Tax=Syngnathus scovelli TaxID=161590 RepID=UPI00210FCF26|nr:uncharacterized protein LOC125977315 [Syngnathus scovelli]
MAFQNRIALDMLLAKEHGVCGMFGDACCTFIPNNTAPGGRLIKTLEGLRILNKKMKDHSGVYIPPSNIEGDRIAALGELYQAVSEQQTAHPDGFTIFAGDFNHANLKSVFPRLHQHVPFPTRGDSFLDLVYSAQKGAFKATPLPHLGLSDHLTVLLLPAYRQLVKASRPVRRRVRVWPEGASDALCNCFDTTDWDLFKQAATYNDWMDIEEYTDSVTSYITKCIDDVTCSKSVITRANWKPWLTGAVLRLLRARDKAFRAGDEAGLRTARADLSRGIKEAKKAFSCKVSTNFKDSKDARSLWRGIQTITDYKPAPRSCEGDVRLLNDLNRFFARFDAQNSTCPLKTTPPPTRAAPAPLCRRCEEGACHY